ncbi:MAG: hypothetical protein HDT20_04400 [Oscillibacter sp.]|nr:hypothetical protein [Oscillibacter sp.]
MIDLSKFPCHKKPYADSTLRNMRKDELIGILRDYEHNYGALYSFYENSVKNAEALLKQAERLTLGDILAVLRERDRVFIVHRMGPHECEGVAGGTVQELRSTRCVEVCGDNVVERLALDVDEYPEWPEEPVSVAPVLLVTIGGKAVEA